MIKKYLLILSFLIYSIPVSASELEKLFNRNDKLFLYLHTSNCAYCIKFSPIYEKLRKKYSDKCDFIKMNANTQQGYRLMYETRASYVPNVIIADTKKQLLSKITPDCLLNETCVNKIVKNFIDN